MSIHLINLDGCEYMEVYDLQMKENLVWKSLGLIEHLETATVLKELLEKYMKDYNFKLIRRIVHTNAESFYKFHKGLNIFESQEDLKLFARFFIRTRMGD
jgi:hypothetical protein